MRSPRPTVLTTRLTYLNRRHQTPFRGLIDVLRGFRKISSSNSVALFPFVLIASLSPSLVGDLVNLDFSLSALAYGLY